MPRSQGRLRPSSRGARGAMTTQRARPPTRKKCSRTARVPATAPPGAARERRSARAPCFVSRAGSARCWPGGSGRTAARARRRGCAPGAVALRDDDDDAVFGEPLPASRISRTATSLGSDGERRTSKRSCTADDTLLTFCPPGRTSARSFLDNSQSSIEMVSVTRSMAASRPSILLRQHLALFHRRLVEGVDAEQVRGDDGLQHEMHQQFAELSSSSLGR